MRPLQFHSRDYSDLARAINEIEFFEDLTLEQMNIVLPCAQLWECDASQIIFAQGDPGDSFHIIQRGRVAVRLKSGFLGRSRRIATLGPGEYFGEIALLYPEPRMATIECLEPTRLFTFVTKDFDYIIAKYPFLAEKIRRVADRRRYQSLHTS